MEPDASSSYCCAALRSIEKSSSAVLQRIPDARTTAIRGSMYTGRDHFAPHQLVLLTTMAGRSPLQDHRFVDELYSVQIVDSKP